jgi:hypothetical protein
VHSAMNKISLFVYFYLNNFFLKNIILNLSTLIPNPSFATDYTTNQKGGIILKYKSFLYQKEREITDKIILRCLDTPQKKCRGRLH